MNKLSTGPLAVEQVEVAIADLPPSLEGLKLAQLSDFHVDRDRRSLRLLEAAVAVCKAVQPDLVLLTGDFVTTEPEPIQDLISGLQALQSRYGTYASLGNHDNHMPRTRAGVTAALVNAGIPVLWNEVVEVAGLDLAIVGLADFWSREFAPAAVFAQIPEGTPRLVLSHNPDSAEYLQAWRVDLQLSGHTHGGQVVIPGMGPVGKFCAELYRALPKAIAPLIPVIGTFHRTLKHWEWSEGLHRVGRNQLYVNRGLGTYFPGRCFCPPELTIITLVRQG
jgi:uncharacterized protein